MFSFKLPKWNKRIDVKTLSIVVTVIYVLSLLPLIIIGHYNWLSSDDFVQAEAMYKNYLSTGNVVSTFFLSFKYTLEAYLNWMGCYLSDWLFRVNPCMYGEKMYFLVIYEMLGILTFGVCYFFKSLFVYGFKGDKHLANVVAMISLIIMVHSLPAGGPRVEIFYWYTGASHYTFSFGLGLFWLGLLIRTVFTEDNKARVRKFCWLCFWSLVVGGSNYLTAISLAVCSVLIIIMIVMEKVKFLRLETGDEGQKKIFKLLWIPAVLYLIGFAVNAFSPGNAERQAITNGFGPVKSIFIAFYYVFDLCINQLLRWEMLVLLALLLPIMWKLAGTIKHRFEHPFIFTLFCFGMNAATMVPPIFAIGNVDAGRLRANIIFIFTLMLVLVLFYWTAWIRQQISDTAGDSILSETETFIMEMLTVFLLFGSALSVKADPYYFTWSSAVTDLANGSAKVFYEESVERLVILKDDSIQDAVLKPHSVRPEMLAFDDVTDNTEDWINVAMARYYGKNSVRIEKEQ